MAVKKNSKRILITGAGGFIGKGLYERLQPYNPVGIVFHLHKDDVGKNLIEADLRDEQKVKAILKDVNPTTVFHFAAFLSPKKNEENPQCARETNVGITQNIVNNLPDDTHVIFPSTDKVFDGFDPNPDEEARVNPLWLYADFKCQCEEIIKRKMDRYHIVRLPIVHSWEKYAGLSTRTGRSSFIDNAIIDLRAGRKVTVFNNVQRCFLRLEELLHLFEIFIDDKNYGIYHVGTKVTSYYERLCFLCDELGIDWKNKIVPIEGEAKPLVQNLNTEKLRRTFGVVLT